MWMFLLKNPSYLFKLVTIKPEKAIAPTEQQKQHIEHLRETL
jgi:hypothetical protein